MCSFNSRNLNNKQCNIHQVKSISWWIFLYNSTRRCRVQSYIYNIRTSLDLATILRNYCPKLITCKNDYLKRCSRICIMHITRIHWNFKVALHFWPICPTLKWANNAHFDSDLIRKIISLAIAALKRIFNNGHWISVNIIHLYIARRYHHYMHF